MTSPSPDRLHRLNRAVDAFLEFQARGPGADAQAFLAQHADLADLLEPMVDSVGESVVASAIESAIGSAIDSGASTAAETEEHRAVAAAGRLVGDGSGDDALPSAGPQPGCVFGDYRILREVGRGGMGAVFEAEQISLSRRVALKLLHGHLALSARAIGRFRSEAAAAARLNHPGIVPIYEVGERGGHHFFTMEFVDGSPLNALIHRDSLETVLGQRDGRSRPASAAELVAQVADALQCAHDNGLVHRDVKPHNIMVSDSGIVRLLDFGLAKHLDRRLSSASGFLGTPYYMSPEQAAGDASIGPRSDVFSLGVVLYELLAGTRPFDGETPQAVVRSIENRDPPPLARVAPRIPKDLDTICGRAMEKEPGHRYVSAGAMAADLRRFLRFEPILAQPPRAVDHATKWLRRHRRGVLLGGVLALVALGGGLAYAVQQRQANERIADETQRAVDSDGLAFRGIEELLGVLSETVGRDPGRAAADRERIAPVMELCDDYLSQAGQDLDRRQRVAVAFFSIAGIHHRLRDLGPARRAIDSGLQAMELVVRERPEQRSLLGAMLRCKLVLEQERHGGGAEVFAAAARLFEPLVEERAEERVEELAGDDLLAEWMELLLTRGLFLVLQSPERGAGVALLERAQQIGDRLSDERKQALGYRRCRARVLGGLAHARGAERQPKAGLELIDRALAAVPLPSKDLGNEQVQVGLLAERSNLYRISSRAAESKQALVEALAIVRNVLRDDPGNMLAVRSAVEIYTGLANNLIVARKAGEAEALLRESLEIVGPWRGRADDLPVDLRTSLAGLLAQLGNSLLAGALTHERTTEAEALFVEAAAVLGDVLQDLPTHFGALRDLGATWSNFASLRCQQKRWEEALEFANRAVAYQRRALVERPGDSQSRVFLGLHLAHIAAAQHGMGDPAAAIATSRAAIEAAPDSTVGLRELAKVCAAIAVDERYSEFAAGAIDAGGCALRRLLVVRPTLGPAVRGYREFAPLLAHPDFSDLTKPAEDR